MKKVIFSLNISDSLASQFFFFFFFFFVVVVLLRSEWQMPVHRGSLSKDTRYLNGDHSERVPCAIRCVTWTAKFVS